jgi:hypothetical protein
MRSGRIFTSRATAVLEKDEFGATRSMIRAIPSSEAKFLGMSYSYRLG